MAIFDGNITQYDEWNSKKDLLCTTLLSIGDAVIIIDKEGLITDFNDSARGIIGYSEEIKGKIFSETIKLVNKTTEEEIRELISKVFCTGETIDLANNTSFINKEGRHIFITGSISPIKKEKGEILGAVMVFRDVTKEEEQKAQLFLYSHYDYLTGLYNRRFLENEIKRLDTPGQLPLGVIMGDVNGLKLANDAFGYKAGDKLLKKVAEVIMQNCRQEDIIGRWGGDEFLILLPKTNAEKVEEIGKKIKNACSLQIIDNVQCSISLGSAVKTKEKENFDQILEEAEEWLYNKKLLEGGSHRNIIMKTMLSVLSEKSMETEKHCERLGEYCLAVGRKLKFSNKELNELNLLAKIHDIGKIAVKDCILKKAGPLTSEEWVEMKKHSQIGYNIALNIPELSNVAKYILFHHEHWDGNGYPRGLKGNEIPLPSRIISVADAYDVMTNDRVYRKAMSKENALAELKRNAGTQFDPIIVDIFVEIIKKIYI